MNTKIAFSTFLTCTLLFSTAGWAEGDASLATQIQTKRVFSSRIEWFGEQEPAEAESAEILRAIAAFEPDGVKAGIAALASFVAAHPQSAWTPSLHAHLAGEYRRWGLYSLALVHWEATWRAMKGSKDARGQNLAVGAMASQACLLAALGQKDKLEGLLKELDDQQLALHSHATTVAAARARLATLKARPGDSYRCGLLALRDFAKELGQDGELKRRERLVLSPEGGFSLAQLVAVAETNGIEVVAVRRPPGAELVVPCLVHWRLNHYAAILELQGDRYRVSDPSFGSRLWIAREVVEAEASGAFLLPRNRVPANWQRLTAPESATIQGSGYPNAFPDWDDGPNTDCDGGDDDDADCDPPSANDGADEDSSPPPCCDGSDSGSDPATDDSGGGNGYLQGDDPANYGVQGWSPFGTQMPGAYGMPRWRVSEPYITLWLHDTPLRYRLSSGKWMQLKLNYKHRGQNLGAQIGGFGTKWYCNWLAMLQTDSPLGQTPDAITNLLAGGGIQWFQTNGAVDYKTARAAGGATPVGGIAVEPIYVNPPAPPSSDTATTTMFPVGTYKDIGAISSTETWAPVIARPPKHILPRPDVIKPAGSQRRFEFHVSDLTRATNHFLTHRMDRYGRAMLFNYQTNATLSRLASIVDVDGRTNRLYYTNTTFPHLITSIVSPYSQTARFIYDNLGRLTNIVDAAGMSSSFRYDSNDNITNMATPYGQTAFQPLEGANDQWQCQNRALLVTEPNGQSQLYEYCDNGPAGVGTDHFPSYRNSYHWDRAQYEAISQQGKTNILNMPDADCQLAQIKHWLHSDITSVSDTLNAMAGPVDPVSLQRIGTYSFFYQGQDLAQPFLFGTLKRVTQVVGPGGESLDIARNDLGRPLVLTRYNPSPVPPCITSNVFDASGSFLQTQTGSRGELVRGYGYHPVITNLLISVTNAVGDVIRYTHDTNNMKVTSITFPSGLVRTNIYYSAGASKGFLWQQIDLGVRTNYFGYSNGNLAAKTNELGLVTTYLWDALDRLVSTAFPDGTTVSNLYDKLDLVGRKDRLNHWTWYGYNPIRQLTSVTNANSQVTQYEYCSCGSPTHITRWIGGRAIATEFSYDIAGRLTNTLYADGYQVSRVYDYRNVLTDIMDSGGRHAQIDYTPFGLHLAVSSAYLLSGQVRVLTLLSNTRDEYGRVIQSTDQNGVITTNGFDLLGRLTGRQVFSSSGVLSGLESFLYDTRGLTNYFDPLGHRTDFVRDTAGRVLYQTNANQEVLRFTYNPKGQLLTLTDGKNQTTTWHYDQYARVTNKVDAASTEIFRYQYDPAGRLTNRWTVAKGNTG